MSPEPMPIPNDNVVIADLVIADIRERKEVGRVKYGTYLQPFNGRSALQDAYEEVLDLAQYLKQKIVEEQGIRTFYQENAAGQVILAVTENVNDQ